MPLQDANPTPSFGGFGLRSRVDSLVFLHRRPIHPAGTRDGHSAPSVQIAGFTLLITWLQFFVLGLSSLARIHRRTPMDGVRAAEGGG